jgi:hypothetical protein
MVCEPIDMFIDAIRESGFNNFNRLGMERSAQPQ